MNDNLYQEDVGSRRVDMPDVFQDDDKKKRPATVTILKPLEEVVRFFRDFSSFARVFDGLDRVERLGQDHHRWFGKGEAASWETQIIVDEPRCFAWKSREGGEANMIGAMTFEPAFEGRATVVSLKIMFPSPSGGIASLVRKLKGDDPDTHDIKSLRYLKALLETGEIPTTQGQPSGREESAAA